jgi:hypothetical protein
MSLLRLLMMILNILLTNLIVVFNLKDDGNLCNGRARFL